MSFIVMSKNQRILAELLAERGRLHAYEIKRILSGVMGHGSVYGTLTALEAKGYARSEWQLPIDRSEGGGPPRKYFELTELGRERLTLELAWEEAYARARQPVEEWAAETGAARPGAAPERSAPDATARVGYA